MVPQIGSSLTMSIANGATKGTVYSGVMEFVSIHDWHPKYYRLTSSAGAGKTFIM